MNTKTNNTTSKQYHENHKKIINWGEYNRSLIQRGNMSIYIDEAIANGANQKPKKTGQTGRPREYSDDLILLILTIRELFRLPLRSTVGFMEGLLGTMGLDWQLPDYSTLSRRMGKLEVDFCRNIRPKLHAQLSQGSRKLILAIDSSGFKVFGEGEWKVRKHGVSYRRTWRESHIAIDFASRDIFGIINTKSGTHDATQFKPLIESVKQNIPNANIDTVIGDGAYDANDFYRYAEDEWFHFIAPPQKNATVRIGGSRRTGIYEIPGWEDRNNVVREIMRLGRNTETGKVDMEEGIRKWKKKVGYHRRSLVENTFYRLKTIFGGNLRSRNSQSQHTEQCIRASLINRFNAMGLPKYKNMYPNPLAIT